MFAAFAGLAVFAIPEIAGVDQEFSGVIHAAPGGRGVAAEGLGCASVPGLAEVDPLFLRGGGTHLPPVPLASVPLVLGLGPCTGVLLLLTITLFSTMASIVAWLMVFGKMKVFQTPRISW